jgi:hypothetical protein
MDYDSPLPLPLSRRAALLPGVTDLPLSNNISLSDSHGQQAGLDKAAAGCTQSKFQCPKLTPD